MCKHRHPRKTAIDKRYNYCYFLFSCREMSSNFWNLKISDIPKWSKANVSLSSTVRLPVKAACAYTNYYRGSARPIIHLAVLAMVVNYLFEFKHLRKHEALRKYH